MRFIRILIMMALILGGSVAWGRTVTGTVVDAETDEPLPYARVWLKKSKIGVLTDEEGRFSLSFDKAIRSDSLHVSYMSYPKFEMPVDKMPSNLPVLLTPSGRKLDEVSVRPAGKIKKKTVGKRHASGGWTMPFNRICYNDEAENRQLFFELGFEIDEPKKRSWLTGVGFYILEDSLMLSRLKFRINIYDISKVTVDPTDEFINITSKPLIFEYRKEDVKDGKYYLELPEPVYLQKQSVVAIELLEEPNPKEVWNFKCNLFGSSDISSDTAVVKGVQA